VGGDFSSACGERSRTYFDCQVPHTFLQFGDVVTIPNVQQRKVYLRELGKILNNPNAICSCSQQSSFLREFGLEALLSAADHFQLITPSLSCRFINRNGPHLSLSLQEIQSSLS